MYTYTHKVPETHLHVSLQYDHHTSFPRLSLCRHFQQLASLEVVELELSDELQMCFLHQANWLRHSSLYRVDMNTWWMFSKTIKHHIHVNTCNWIKALQLHVHHLKQLQTLHRNDVQLLVHVHTCTCMQLYCTRQCWMKWKFDDSDKLAYIGSYKPLYHSMPIHNKIGCTCMENLWTKLVELGRDVKRRHSCATGGQVTKQDTCRNFET